MKNDDVAELVHYRLEQARTALDDARFLLDAAVRAHLQNTSFPTD